MDSTADGVNISN